jgi:anti-anti-sigma factor
MALATAMRQPAIARVPIDIAVADELRVRLELVAVADPHAPHISGLIIDMTHMNIVDSAGLRALQAVRDHASELGIALCVAAPGESVRRLLHLTDLTGRTPVYTSISAAVSACSPPVDTPGFRPDRWADDPIEPDTHDRSHSWSPSASSL